LKKINLIYIVNDLLFYAFGMSISDKNYLLLYIFLLR